MKTITSELPTWVEEANDLSNDRIKWDWLQFKIKMSSIAFSKKMSREIAQRRPWGWHGVGVLKPLGLFSLIIQLFNDKLKDIQHRRDYGVAEACHFLVKLLLLNLFYFQKCYIFFQFCLLQRRLLNNLTLSFITFCGRDPIKLLDQQ